MGACAGEYDEAKIQEDCKKQFGIRGDVDWSVISLGGLDWSTASNIVFSNGEYDPWKIGRLPWARAHVKFSDSPTMHNIYTQ